MEPKAATTAPVPAKRVNDAELIAMSEIVQIMNELDATQQRRIAAWFDDRFGEQQPDNF